MNSQSPTGLYLATSIVITILLHILLWQAANYIQLRAFIGDLPVKERDHRLQFQELDWKELMKPETPPELRFDRHPDPADDVVDVFQTAGIIEAPKARPQAVLDGLGRDILKQLPTPTDKPAAGPRTSPPPKILQIQAASLPLDRRLEPRRKIPEIKRYDLTDRIVPSLVSNSPSGVGPARETVGLSMRMRLPPSSLPTLPAPTVPDHRQPEQNPPNTPVTGVEVDTNILDSDLAVTVSSYLDEAAGQRYFRVDISTRPSSERLTALPRKVLFLVDASASMTRAKLRQFRDGLAIALDRLAENDLFNVIAFRAEPVPLFQSFVPAAERYRRQAISFIGDLRSSGSTDVYSGLAPYVSAAFKATDERQYMIFLLSDGRSTAGAKLENDEFVRRIMRENHAQASIFSFCAGEKSNLFLMDMLSYTNRGFSLHTPEVKESDQALAGYVNGLSEILVADLRCQITGTEDGDIYPRQLPHLFRGHPLTVYGRVPSRTKDIGIRIVGLNAQGKREELILPQHLGDAATAGPELPRAWAAQKIYFLFRERASTESPELDAEIQRLAAEHHVALPY